MASSAKAAESSHRWLLPMCYPLVRSEEIDAGRWALSKEMEPAVGLEPTTC